MDGSPLPQKSETVRLFSDSGQQAVHLPEPYRFEGRDVSIRRQGDRVILEPVRARRPLPETVEGWKARFVELDALTDEPFPEPPPQGLAEPIERL